jgi:hypothetical protein
MCSFLLGWPAACTFVLLNFPQTDVSEVGPMMSAESNSSPRPAYTLKHLTCVMIPPHSRSCSLSFTVPDGRAYKRCSTLACSHSFVQPHIFQGRRLVNSSSGPPDFPCLILLYSTILICSYSSWRTIYVRRESGCAGLRRPATRRAGTGCDERPKLTPTKCRERNGMIYIRQVTFKYVRTGLTLTMNGTRSETLKRVKGCQ